MLWRAFAQVFLLPFAAFAAGAEVMGRAFGAMGQVAGRGFDAMVSGMVQAAAAPAGARQPAGEEPVPAGEEAPAAPPDDRDLGGEEDVKLVRYALLSVERERERLLETGEELVTGALPAAGFEALVLGRGSRRAGLAPEEHRFLRVWWRVLARYERPPWRHEERQVAALEGIRDALRETPGEAPAAAAAGRGDDATGGPAPL
jgi:hypothetical protein